MTTPAAPPAHTTTNDSEAAERASIIRWIVVAILIWGVVLALGSWSLNWNPLRPVIVLGCVGAFLGFWMAMLAARQRRLSKRR